MSRRKPDVLVIGDVAGADAALAELGEIERALGGVENDMNEAIDTAKAVAEGTAAPLKERRKILESALGVFGESRKGELFKDKKSLELQFGVLGFRKSTKVLTQSKTTLAMVLERLKEFGFQDAITTKESVNKETLRGWPEERLATVGMRRVVSDDFYLELKQEAVRQD